MGCGDRNRPVGGPRGTDMEQLRVITLRTIVWGAKKAFEVGDQVHRGWVLANSDRNVQF